MIAAVPALVLLLALACACCGCGASSTTTTTPAVTSTTYVPVAKGQTRTSTDVTPEVVATSKTSEDGTWVRDYGPLLTGGIALLIAVTPLINAVARRPRFVLETQKQPDDVVPGGDGTLFLIRLRVRNRRFCRTARDVEVVAEELVLIQPGTLPARRPVGPLTGRGLAWVHGAREQEDDEAGVITIAPGSERFLGLLRCRAYDGDGQVVARPLSAAEEVIWDPILLALPRPKEGDPRFHLALQDGKSLEERASLDSKAAPWTYELSLLLTARDTPPRRATVRITVPKAAAPASKPDGIATHGDGLWPPIGVTTR
jgi:hypothetical protein